MATDWLPTAPAAPALLAMTTGCLTRRSSAAASGRAVRSAMPPGGNGTTMVMGRLGYGSWPAAGAAEPARARASGRAASTRRRMGNLLQGAQTRGDSDDHHTGRPQPRHPIARDD